VVNQALGGHRGTYPLVDDPDDFHNPQSVGHMSLDAVTHPHGRGSLGRASVDPDVPGPAGHGGRRAGLVQAHGPQPLIDSSCFDLAMVPRGANIRRPSDTSANRRRRGCRQINHDTQLVGDHARLAVQRGGHVVDRRSVSPGATSTNSSCDVLSGEIIVVKGQPASL
jgi:hypothetical protein